MKPTRDLYQGSSGKDVVELQRALLALGCSLPKYGADGNIGRHGGESWNALDALFRVHRDGVDPTPDVVTIAEQQFVYALLELMQDRAAPIVAEAKYRILHDDVADPGGVEAMTFEEFAKLHIVDRRAYHKPSIKGADGVIRRYWPATRAPGQLRGDCFHQTACYMGVKIERYDTIGAHWTVIDESRVTRHCDDNRIIFHGHGFNNQCTSVEVNIRTSGLEDDPTTAPREDVRTTWDSPSTPERDMPQRATDGQLRMLRMVTRWKIINAKRQYGETIRVIVSHRQSSRDRQGDPGQRIYHDGLRPLLLELGLNDGGAGFAIGGYPIPTKWNPDYRRADGTEIPY